MSQNGSKLLGAVLGSLLLAWLPRALALDPDRRISQYAHTAWRVRDGAFAGAPTAIAQTTDGYVWIGTLAGLLRFDGVRFVPLTPPIAKHLPNPAVISLLGATDGSLWIGTASGLAEWKNGKLVNFPKTAGRVNSIYEDRDGTIWITRSRTNAGGVCKISASVAICYGPKDGVPPFADALIRDNLGYFLIGTDTAIVRWKPGFSASYELPGLKSKTGLSGISDLAIAPDGSIWVGIIHSGHGLGLEQWVNGSLKTLITPALDGSRLRVTSLRLDRHNALWIGTAGTGIYRVRDGNVDRFDAADGLSSDSVQYAFEDREGNLWLTTTEGVDCFRGRPVVNFSIHEGLTADEVSSILAARDGTVWIGNRGGLDLVRGNVVSSIGPRNGLSGDRVTALFEDHAGRLWVGMDNGLFVYEHSRFTRLHRPDGNRIGTVVAMTEDVDNNVWAAVIHTPPGRPTKLTCFRDGRFVKEISDQRLDIISLAGAPQGGLWLGLRQGGLARYRNDQVQIFPFRDENAQVYQVLANLDGSVLAATNDGLVDRRGDSQHILDGKNGLPCNRIYALVTDKHSHLWLYAECGLIEIKADEVQRWREHPDLKVEFDLFDAFDGAQPFLPPFRPIATRSNDGRLWFANESVAQMIDPDRVLRNPILPPVHIEDVIADRKTYSSHDGLHLPALTRDLQIDYTGLSFVVPQKVRFRYKLEGYDRDWQDAGTRRQAFYSNLSPRSYTFRVKACNNDDVWNDEGAFLQFGIAPAFYQTNWFLLLCAAVLVFLVWTAFQWRMRQVQALAHIQMEERSLERARIARELHDTLLQSFQGLVLNFQRARNLLPRRPTEAAEVLDSALDRAERALVESRDAIHDIRSSMLVANDLAKELTALSEELALDSRYPEQPTFHVVVEGTPQALNRIVRDEIYRIAREAIRNAYAHSRARRIQAEISYDEKLFRLRVRDNGVGMVGKLLGQAGRVGHWGLPGMRERATRIGGHLEVRSERGAGTEIELRFPRTIAYGPESQDAQNRAIGDEQRSSLNSYPDKSASHQ